MGQEIFYCFSCQTQLRTADLERGAAFRVESRIFCSKCSRQALQLLSPEQAQALLKSAADPVEPARTPTARQIRSSTTAMQTLRGASTSEASDRGLTWALWGVGIAVLGLVFLVFFAASETRPAPPAPAERGPLPAAEPPARREREAVVPSRPPLPDSSSAETPPKRNETAARASLKRALDYERESPEDVEGQRSRYVQARWDSKGTVAEQDADRAFEAFQKKQQARLDGEIASLEAAISPLLAKEDFKGAFGMLEEASARSPRAALKEWLDRRRREAESALRENYALLRAQAIDAQKRGVPAELGPLREKVRGWGDSSLALDLERAITDNSGPALPPEARKYRSSWERAMALSSVRAYPEALRELEASVRDLREPSLRTEAARDLDLLRQVTTVPAEALGAAARAVKGQKVKWEYWDESGKPQPAQGVLLKADLQTVEIRRDRDVLVIPAGELTPRTLADLYRGRPQRRPAADEAVAGLFLLGEGDASPGKAPDPPAEASAAKYRQWAQALSEAAAASDRMKRESDARSLFYAAEHDRSAPASEADGALKCRALLKDYPDAAFVRRNQALILSRTQGAKDFGFVAEDLAGTGIFKLETAKAGSLWTAGSDAEPAARTSNYVELRFSALEDLSYRCWVYVGGCCAETLAFAVQGSELRGAAAAAGSSPPSAEAGEEAAVPVKHSVGNVVRTHASHGTGKRPQLWGWAEIPLPRYAHSGPKLLRVLGDRQGFSLKFAVVSATRTEPPAEGELRELEKTWISAYVAAARAVGNFIRDPGYEGCRPGENPSLKHPWIQEGAAIIGAEKQSGRNQSICCYFYYPDKTVTTVSTVSQRVWVTPHTNYELSVWIKTCMDYPGGTMGVRSLGGSLLGQKAIAGSEAYANYRVLFNSGSNTALTVFAAYPNSAGSNSWMHVDDWLLVER